MYGKWYFTTHIANPLPVVGPGLGLDGASGKELIVLRSPHPEILHELDGVIPLLVSVGPEQLGNIRKVHRVLANTVICLFVQKYDEHIPGQNERPSECIGGKPQTQSSLDARGLSYNHP